jgi:hypothetical protein
MAAAVSYREILLRRIAEAWGRNNIRPMRDETDRAKSSGFRSPRLRKFNDLLSDHSISEIVCRP